jgi:predicted naringenin-chalcone synthase
MFVTGIGTAVPPQRYRKKDCWEAFRESKWFDKLSTRAHAVAAAVLLKNNGIETRHLAVDSLNDVFSIDPDTLHRRFLEYAPALASDAARRALAQAGLRPGQIDAIVVSTCTGYVCPGLSGYVAERIGLDNDVEAYDLVGQGCAAALPNLRLGETLLSSGRCAHVLSVCVEICSAAMYLDDDPGVMISACLFGDGAGAAVLSRQPNEGMRRIEWKNSASLINQSHRTALQFEQRNGLLRNILTREVPALAAQHAQQVLQTVTTRAGLERSDIRVWIMHAGGRDVLVALQKAFGVSTENFCYSAAILRDYGNLSSAFVYFVLQAALDDNAEDGWWWLSSFGAGFSCHGALLYVGETRS